MTEFVSLTRDGAYMAGDRRVSRTERSKWRVTFRRLATEAHSALHAADTGPGQAAMEKLIELACEASSGGYFHSEDPLEAARFVVSHAVSALWQTVLDQHGMDRFAERAVPQLIRWESRYGWTRGDGKVSDHETSLAEVLEPFRGRRSSVVPGRRLSAIKTPSYIRNPFVHPHLGSATGIDGPASLPPSVPSEQARSHSGQ